MVEANSYIEHPDGSRDLQTDWSYLQTWKELEKLLKTGKVKAIGVANFSVKYLEELLPTVEVVPAVNQIENHPYLPQQDIVDLCKKNGIHVTAYSPFGSTGSPLFGEKEIQEAAKKHGVSPGSVLLSYHGMKLPSALKDVTNPPLVARGNSVIPKSVTPSRIEENMRIIKLDSSDIKGLDHISQTKPPNRFVYPEFGVSHSYLRS